MAFKIYQISSGKLGGYLLISACLVNGTKEVVVRSLLKKSSLDPVDLNNFRTVLNSWFRLGSGIESA